MLLQPFAAAVATVALALALICVGWRVSGEWKVAVGGWLIRMYVGFV